MASSFILYAAALSLGSMSSRWRSGMLGHYSAGFTLDTYAHVTTAAQKAAAETMSGVLSVNF